MYNHEGFKNPTSTLIFLIDLWGKSKAKQIAKQSKAKQGLKQIEQIVSYIFLEKLFTLSNARKRNYFSSYEIASEWRRKPPQRTRGTNNNGKLGVQPRGNMFRTTAFVFRKRPFHNWETPLSIYQTSKITT